MELHHGLISKNLIDDWLGITTFTAEKHGPSLKNTLHGQASFYKHMLNNETYVILI